MSTAGPPTPPPTSETEISDAARIVVPPVPAASTSGSAAPQGGQDAFTQIFPQIASFATEKNYSGLIRVAELNDIASDADRQPSRLLLTAPLVLAYLIKDDLPPARSALSRLPNSLASSPLCKQLMILLASTSERKYENIYARSQSLVDLASQPDFPDAALGQLLCLMTASFLDSFRTRTFNLLQKAYASLPLSLAQMYLGLPGEGVLSAAANAGWAFDASTQVLTPSQKSGTHPTTNGSAPASSLATFDLVADSVAKLEA